MKYEDAGVSLDRAEEVARRLGVMPEMFSLGDRALVASVDGVGTKIRVSTKHDRFEDLGVDLVAMNINDIIRHGATPLFFMNMISMPRIDPKIVERLVHGMRDACSEAGCVLIGGETAEMPDFYREGDFDLAGFAVGIVDKDKRLGPHRVQSGDVIVGMPSSGIHANGLALARKAIGDHPDLTIPTRIYRTIEGAHSAAHITGGGIERNIRRAIPPAMTYEIDFGNWEVPKIFQDIQNAGGISDEEMYRVFNMGIGMAWIMPSNSMLPSEGRVIGRVRQAGG